MQNRRAKKRLWQCGADISLRGERERERAKKERVDRQRTPLSSAGVLAVQTAELRSLPLCHIVHLAIGLEGVGDSGEGRA